MSGELNILSALPKSWQNGEIIGLRARGGFEVDMQWQNGNLTSLSVLSIGGNTLNLRYRDIEAELQTEAGERYAFNGKLLKVEKAQK